MKLPAALGAACLLVSPLAAQDPVVYVVPGTQEGDQFGVSMAPVGDVDGDGAPDFVAGARQEFALPPEGRRGYIRLISGSTGAMIHTWTGQPASRLGMKLATLGDIDGDGITEFVTQAGEAKVIAYSPMTREKLLQVDVKATTDNGNALLELCGSPDMDGDGIRDLVVGDPGFNLAEVNEGIAIAYSGKDGRRLWIKTGDLEQDWLGYAVAALGDVDGDGLGDVAVGRPRERHGVWEESRKLGEVLILRGTDGALLHRLGNTAPFYNFGEALASAGDLDGDGRAELAVAAPGYAEEGGFTQGWVGIYSPPAFKLLWSCVGTDDHIFAFNFHGDALGHRLSSAGDADGDGTPDLLIAAERWSNFFEYRARLDLRSGRTGALLASYEMDQGYEKLLGSLSPLGDVDGDGRSEFLVGAWYHHPDHVLAEGTVERAGAVFALRYEPALPVFVRGDANADGRVDVSDAVTILAHLHLGKPGGECPMALDVNGNDRIGASDVLDLLTYLFLGDLSPTPPFPACGRFGGIRKSTLDCRTSPCQAGA